MAVEGAILKYVKEIVFVEIVKVITKIEIKIIALNSRANFFVHLYLDLI
jgi:hypothetical protein